MYVNDESPYYQTVCLKGHQQRDYAKLDELLEDQGFCTICGSKIITKCPECDQHFLGFNNLTKGYVEPIPQYCSKCGAPLPWTLETLKTFDELLDLEDKLSIKEKDKIKGYLPDLINETPSTETKASIVKVYLSNASKTVGALIYNFLVDVVSETAKKTLEGP